MSVYGAAIGLLLISGNYYLISVPAIIGAFHYLKLSTGIQSLATSYDMRKLHQKNKHYRQVFESLKECVIQCEDLKPYFTNKETLLIHNPFFQYFQFREKGLVSRLDEQRERFLYECVIQDSVTDAQGKIQSIVSISHIDKTALFETLTLHLEKPDKKRIKVVKLNVDEEAEEIYPKDTPRGTERSRSSDKL